MKEGPRLCKLSNQQTTLISDRLTNLQGLLTSEFARQPRSLSKLKRWETTELKQFLLYTEIHVLKGVIFSEPNRHFLSLSLAVIIILYSDNNYSYKDKFEYAKILIRWFVSTAKHLYEESFL